MTLEHAADQAGGEVVYASDGPADGVAPPAVAVRFPIRTATDTIEGVLDERSQTTAVQAFEVFSGKLYAPTASDSTGNNSRGSLQPETPLERLARLQRELAELEQSVTGGNGPLSDTDTDAAVDQDDWNRTVSDLQTRLQQTRHAYQWPQQQEQLTAALERAVQQGGSSPAAVPAASATTTQPPTSTTAALEERMRRLEVAVGSNSTNSSTTSMTPSWSERLRVMESQVSKLDSHQLQVAVNRSKVIRQDLEAASKARNKLLSASSRTGSSANQSTDAQKIQDLYRAHSDLQGMAQHLAPLAQRLAVLSHYHQDQATWACRLRAVEETAQKMAENLASLEGAVDKVAEGWTVNAAHMESNMKALDARMTKK
jgi:hypothetical protein